MRARGWRPTRNHVGLFSTPYGGKVSIGTPGFPDWTFRRVVSYERGIVELMHVEIKRPGQKPRPKQFEVIASLNHIGEIAVWAASLTHFESVYALHFDR
ncbi:MAG: hypothetical protein ACREHG_02615 [Candidatus Saccharimonadales bacterium]